MRETIDSQAKSELLEKLQNFKETLQGVYRHAKELTDSSELQNIHSELGKIVTKKM